MPLGPDHLTPNFKITELTKTSSPHANVPTAEARCALKALCSAVLEPLREKVGRLEITSGYRSPLVNQDAGGSRSSQHLRGEAADLRPMDHDRLGAWLILVEMIEAGLPVDQAILYETTTHVHVSHTARRVARRSIRVFTQQGTFEPWATFRDLPDLEARFNREAGFSRGGPTLDPERLPHPPDDE
ncbi:MAG: D-Ala-D-Ala carboxypeptidase family metallohydrolase [Myxococcota bacterium]